MIKNELFWLFNEHKLIGRIIGGNHFEGKSYKYTRQSQKFLNSFIGIQFIQFLAFNSSKFIGIATLKLYMLPLQGLSSHKHS